jgi:hypothetical protein
MDDPFAFIDKMQDKTDARLGIKPTPAIEPVSARDQAVVDARMNPPVPFTEWAGDVLTRPAAIGEWISGAKPEEDDLDSLLNGLEEKSILKSRKAERDYVDQADPALVKKTEDILKYITNSSNRFGAMEALRDVPEAEKAEIMRLVPGVMQRLGDDRGNIAVRALGAFWKGVNDVFINPMEELAYQVNDISPGRMPSMFLTPEERETARYLEGLRSQETAPSRADDSMFVRGALGAIEMAPFAMGAARAGAAGATVGAKAIPWITGMSSATGAAVGSAAGVTAASFPSMYIDEYHELKSMGMADSGWLRATAAVSAVGGGLIESIVPNPFPGKVRLTQGVSTAIRQYMVEAAKKYPVELSEEGLQGLWSGLTEHVAQYLDDNVEDRSIADAINKGFAAMEESALPLVFMMGAPAAGAAGLSIPSARKETKKFREFAEGMTPEQAIDAAHRLSQLNEVRSKWVASKEQADAAGIKGETRKERRENLAEEIFNLQKLTDIYAKVPEEKRAKSSTQDTAPADQATEDGRMPREEAKAGLKDLLDSLGLSDEQGGSSVEQGASVETSPVEGVRDEVRQTSGVGTQGSTQGQQGREGQAEGQLLNEEEVAGQEGAAAQEGQSPLPISNEDRVAQIQAEAMERRRAKAEQQDASIEPGQSVPVKPMAGQYVQWTSNGVDQFSEPKKVVKSETRDGKEFLQLEGESTWIPADQATVTSPPASAQFTESGLPAPSSQSQNAATETPADADAAQSPWTPVAIKPRDQFGKISEPTLEARRDFASKAGTGARFTHSKYEGSEFEIQDGGRIVEITSNRVMQSNVSDWANRVKGPDHRDPDKIAWTREVAQAETPAAKPDTPGQVDVIEAYKNDPEIAELLSADAGVKEGYTVEQHTRSVLDNWRKQSPSQVISDIGARAGIKDMPRLMEHVVALHDIGKPQAIKEGDKSKQHEKTLPILERQLVRQGFDQKSIELAKSIVGNDHIGQLIQGKSSPESAAKAIQGLAAKVGMQVDDYLSLQASLYKSDAGAYPALRGSIFTEGASGKLTLPDVNFGILEEIIYGKVQEVGWSERVGEKGKGLERGRIDRGGVGGRYVHGSAVRFDSYDESKDSGKNRFGKGLYLVDEADSDVASHYAMRAITRILTSAGFSKDLVKDIMSMPVEKLRKHQKNLSNKADEFKKNGNAGKGNRYDVAAEVLGEVIAGRIGEHVLSVDFIPKNTFEMGAEDSGGRVMSNSEIKAILQFAPETSRSQIMTGLKDQVRSFEFYNKMSKVLGGRSAATNVIRNAGYDSIQFVHVKGGYNRPYNVIVVLETEKAAVGGASAPSENAKQQQARDQAPPAKKQAQDRTSPAKPVAQEKAKPAVSDDDRSLLKEFGIEVSSDGDMIYLQGKTYDYRKQIKQAGGAAARTEGKFAWRIDPAGLGKLVAQLGGLARPGGKPGDRRAAYLVDSELKRSREDVDRRPDTRKSAGDLAKLVSDDTKALISRGLAIGMPQSVVDEQIQDVGYISDAYSRNEGVFLLASEPGSGKTFVLGGAIKELKAAGAKRVVYVTLRSELISQIKSDLAEFGIEDVQFVTYPGLRTLAVNPTDVLIFDEAHSVKNVGSGKSGSKQAKRAAEWIAKSRFTVFASATPFENPVQAKYLEPTGVFDDVGGFRSFAGMFGARLITVGDTEVAIWERGKDSDVDAKAAQEYMVKRGLMTSRRIQLPPNQVDSRLVKIAVSDKDSSRYSLLSRAAEQNKDRLGGFGKAWIVNFQKRLLEMSKIGQAIKEAKAAISRGRFPIIFVETKAERVFDIPALVERELEYERAAAAAKRMNDSAPSRKDYGLPPAGVVPTLRDYMQSSGESIITIPSGEDVIQSEFGKGKVAIFTGSVTPTAAQKNLNAWRAGKKPVLVATMAKGGTGLSLHDKVGDHQTTQINLNMPWTATGVVQVAQRSARYGLVGKAEMLWLFADNIPFDQSLAQRVGGRMADMGAVVHGQPLAGAASLQDWDFESELFSEGAQDIQAPKEEPPQESSSDQADKAARIIADMESNLARMQEDKKLREGEKLADWVKAFTGSPREVTAAKDLFRKDFEKAQQNGVSDERLVEIIDHGAANGIFNQQQADDLKSRILRKAPDDQVLDRGYRSFISGAQSSPSDIEEMALQADRPVGVSIQPRTLSERVKDGVRRIAENGQNVFLDSGIASTVAKGQTVDFGKVFAGYRDIIERVDPKHRSRIFVVAPDHLERLEDGSFMGDQGKTYELQSEYRNEIAEMQDLGATVIVPIQRGAKELSVAYSDITDFIDFNNGRTFIGIPYNKGAWDNESILEFAEKLKGGELKLHLLGGGKAKVAALTSKLHEIDPDIVVTGDAASELRNKRRKPKIDGPQQQQDEKEQSSRDAVEPKPGVEISAEDASVLAEAKIQITITAGGNWMVHGLPKEYADDIARAYKGRKQGRGYLFRQNPVERIVEVSREIVEEAREISREESLGFTRTRIGTIPSEIAREYELRRKEAVDAMVQPRLDLIESLRLISTEFTSNKLAGVRKIQRQRIGAKGGDLDSVPGFDKIVQFVRDNPELGLPTDPSSLFELMSEFSFSDAEQKARQDVEGIVDQQLAVWVEQELDAIEKEFEARDIGFQREIEDREMEADRLQQDADDREAAYSQFVKDLYADQEGVIYDLFGNAIKPPKEPKRQAPPAEEMSQGDLFAHRGAPGQGSLFGEVGVPDDMVAFPERAAAEAEFDAKLQSRKAEKELAGRLNELRRGVQVHFQTQDTELSAKVDQWAEGGDIPLRVIGDKGGSVWKAVSGGNDRGLASASKKAERLAKEQKRIYSVVTRFDTGDVPLYHFIVESNVSGGAFAANPEFFAYDYYLRSQFSGPGMDATVNILHYDPLDHDPAVIAKNNLDEDLNKLPDTLFQTESQEEQWATLTADIAFDAKDAGIQSFDDLVAFAVKSIGERRVRLLGEYLQSAARVAGMFGVRPMGEVLGEPSVTRSQVTAFAKEAFKGSPLVTDEMIEAVLDIQDAAAFGRKEIGYAPAGTPIPANAMRQHKSLSVLHNLSVESLEFADRMGGLAAPSLAIVGGDMGLEGYGDITLIGRRELADPESVPVFDADAYTPRFPKPSYPKPKMKDIEFLSKALSAWVDKYQDGRARDAVWDFAASKQSPSDLLYAMLNSNAAKAWFLSENGIAVPPVLSPIAPRWDWAHAKPWLRFVKTANHEAMQLSFDDPKQSQYLKEAGDAFVESVTQRLENSKIDKADADRLIETAKNTFLTDGRMAPGFLYSAMSSARDAGKKSVNREKTQSRVDRKLKGMEESFKSWVEDKVLPMFGEPFIKVGKERRAFNLANIVDYMASGGLQAKESTMAFGEGKARAKAASRIKSLQQLRNASESIKDNAEVRSQREAVKAAMSQWRSKMAEYHEYGIWEAMDSSMRAIAKWAKGRNLADALRSEGFKGVPKHLLEEGVEVGRQFMDTPVPYFEAKPRRVVRLGEFAGAVIPSSAGAKVKDILERNGIAYQTYQSKSGEQGRQSAVNKLRTQLSKGGDQVLFSTADNNQGGTRRIDMSFKDVTKRIPELQDAAKLFKEGKLTKEGYAELVDKYKPVVPYNFVPMPATAADAERALSANKRSAFGNTNETIPAGKEVELRLDIPAYKNHGVWVNSIHHEVNGKRTTSYDSYSAATDIDFRQSPENQRKALAVATGEASKSPFAVIKGKWNPISRADAVKRSQEALTSSEWTQVGYDPERHSYFYDRNTMAPVASASEVIQIGPLVLARNVQYADQSDLLFQQSNQTETPAFKNWFGESKVVDADGKPLVVYHGTAKAFDAFDQDKTMDGVFWFTSDKSSLERGESGAAGVGEIMPVYLSAKKLAGWDEYDRYSIDELIQEGYDGIKLDNDYVIFNPTQIKSATGNQGAFDPNNPSILAQNQEQSGNIKGWTKFISATRAIIGATNKADFSTFIHELFHPMRRFLLDRSIPLEQRAGITDADLQALEDYTGVENGDWGFSHIEDGSAREAATVAAEEKAARAWERYWYEGKSPTAALRELFEKIARWMRDIYTGVQEITNNELTPEVRALFDKIVQRGMPAGIVPPPVHNAPGAPLPEEASHPERISRVEPNGHELTALGKGVMNYLRGISGIPGLESLTPETIAGWLEEAEATLAMDPSAALRLYHDIQANQGRSIDHHEAMLLGMHYRKLQNAVESAEAEVAEAAASKNAQRIASARTSYIQALQPKTEFEEMTYASKSTWGRTGIALQIMMRNDFTVGGLMRRAVTANHGNPLSEAQKSEIQALADKISDLQQKVDEAVARAKRAEAELEYRKQHQQVIETTPRKKRDIPAGPSPTANQPTSSRPVNNLDAAWGNLAKARGINLLFQDEGLLDAVVTAYRELGVTTFAELNRHVQERVGKERARELRSEFLRSWNSTRPEIDVTGVYKSGDPQLTKIARNIQRDLVEAGFTDRIEILKAVRQEMSQMLGWELSEIETMDALSRYGQYSTPDQSGVEPLLRSLNAQHLKERQIIQLGDALARVDELRAENPNMTDEQIGDRLVAEELLVKPTGYQRDQASSIIREMQRKYNELKAKVPVSTEGRNGMLQTALGAIQRRIANRIIDLTRALKEDKPLLTNRRPAQTNAEIEEKRAELAILTAEYRRRFPPKRTKLSDEQKIRNAVRAAERSIEVLERQIATHNFDKPKSVKVWSPELESLVAEKKTLRAHIKALKALELQAWENEGGASGLDRQELARRKVYLASIESRIANYQRMIREKDFAPKKKTVRAFTQEELIAKRRLDDARSEAMEAMAAYHLANLTPFGRFVDSISELAHLSRALMTSMDLSALFNQGALVALSRPVIAARVLSEVGRSMWRSFNKEELLSKKNLKMGKLDDFLTGIDSRQAEMDLLASLTTGEWAELRLKAGLQITSSEQEVTKQEEAFQGRWGKLFPGVAISGRLYTMMLNKMRADMFDTLANSLSVGGAPTLEEAKLIASYVNIATGRSDLSGVPLLNQLEKQSVALNTVFFAPRYVMSRFQYLALPFYLWRMGGVNNRAKAAIYAEYGRTFISFGAILGSVYIASLFFDDDDDDKPTIETDSTKSDFLKVKIGDTRIDFAGGILQAFVLSSRLVQHRVGDRALGEGYKPDTRATVLAKFLRSKLAPVPGYIWTGLNNWEDPVGNVKRDAFGLPVHPMIGTGVNLLIPLSGQEVIEAIQDHGGLKGSVLAALAILGVRIGTYGEKTSYTNGNEESRKELVEKFIRNMQWDSPDPGFSEFLSAEDYAKVQDRREQRRESLVHAALSTHTAKDFKDPEDYQKAIQKRDEAVAAIKQAGWTDTEIRQLLMNYWRRNHGSPRQLRGGFSVLKDGVQARLRQIGKLFGEVSQSDDDL